MVVLVLVMVVVVAVIVLLVMVSQIATGISPFSVVASSKAWVCGQPLAGIAGANPIGEWMSASWECYMLSGRGLYIGLITRPEESYRL
jgi:hypothetical protein